MNAEAQLQDSIEELEKRAHAGDVEAIAALQRFVQDAKNLRIAQARTDPATFLAYVMKDEQSGASIELAPYHLKLQDFLSANDYAGILGHVECGKSMNITVGRVLFELGKNPNLRVAIVMKTADKAKAPIRLIKHYLQHSVELHEVFPHLKRGDGPWNTTKLTVERPSPVKDPSVVGLGLGSNVLGARIDLVILDDVLTRINTLSATMRASVLQYITGTLVGRVGKTGRIWFIANAWHPEDALHVLTKAKSMAGAYGWSLITLPVKGPVNTLVDGVTTVVCGEDGVSNWPKWWTPAYVDKKEELFGGVKHPECQRMLYCQARSDDASRFKRVWIDLALLAGKNIYGDATSLQSHEPSMGARNFTGMDLGVSKKVGADLTAQVHLSGLPDGRIQLLGIESGQFAADEILRRTFDAHRRFNSTIIVENNAAQDYIRQLSKNPDIARALGRTNAERLPVYPFTTTSHNKHSFQFGIEAIGAEMATGRMIFPCVETVDEETGAVLDLKVHPELEALITDMLYYDPQGHTGDRLMAFWFAYSGIRLRTFSWRVGEAEDDDAPNSKHWTDVQREAAEERRRLSSEARMKEMEKAQAASAWGDF